jgi:hypothetical protein
MNITISMEGTGVHRAEAVPWFALVLSQVSCHTPPYLINGPLVLVALGDPVYLVVHKSVKAGLHRKAACVFPCPGSALTDDTGSVCVSLRKGEVAISSRPASCAVSSNATSPGDERRRSGTTTEQQP